MYYWFTCHFYKLLLTSTHLLIQCIYFFYNNCLYQNRVENGLQSFDDTVLCTAPFHVHTVYRHTAASSVQVESLLSLICHIFRKWIVADKWKWMCSFVYLSFLASSRAWLHGRTRSRGGHDSKRHWAVLLLLCLSADIIVEIYILYVTWTKLSYVNGLFHLVILSFIIQTFSEWTLTFHVD